MWAQDEEPGTFSWAVAKTRCVGSTRAGFSDWRLPTRIELVSLVDFGKTTKPTIDATAFPASTIGDEWSSSADALSADHAWLVNVANGITGSVGTSNPVGVRCVR